MEDGIVGGELVKWTQHYVELNGSRVFKVNPAGTSQQCSSCLKKVSFIDYHTVKCSSDCDLTLDRDVNAGINIANRAWGIVEKSVKTRSKARKYESDKDSQVKRSPDPLPGKPNSRKVPKKYKGKSNEKKKSRNSHRRKFMTCTLSDDKKRIIEEVINSKRTATHNNDVTVLADGGQSKCSNQDPQKAAFKSNVHYHHLVVNGTI